MKAIFITGAGSGMGREGATLFHANGWRVGAIDRNEDGLAALRVQLGAERLWARAVDVTDKAALEGALADFCAGNVGGGLDMMWNNAGIGEGGWFEDVPYEAAVRVVDVNFKAVLTGAYAALPYLKKAPGSLMFSTSSSSGTYGMPRIAVYSATKHAVKGLTEALSVEWQRHGVRVADVLPGLIDTAILTSTRQHSDEGPYTISAEQIRAAAPKKGMFRLMPSSSVAEAAWRAYQHPTRLHWYVPRSIRWIDRLKGVSPEFVRRHIAKSLATLEPKRVPSTMLRPEWRWLVCNRLVTVTGVAMVVAAGLSACGQAQTVPRKAARLTIDGVTHTTRPATCSQEHSYRTIDIRNHDSTVQAVVLLSGDRVIPQWVKIRNVDGFNGSFWHGGVGNARADRARNTYTVAGSAYGISSKKPNTVVSTDFNILAEC